MESSDAFIDCGPRIHANNGFFNGALAELFALRMKHIKSKNLHRDGHLPPDERKRVVKDFYDLWLQKKDTNTQMREGCDDVASCFRTYCSDMFGGLLWVHLFAALGDISPSLVKLVQQRISEMISKTDKNDAVDVVEAILNAHREA